MSYVTLLGSKDTAQNHADFDAAVNTAGGPTACVGGVSISGDAMAQAMSVGAPELAALKKFVVGKNIRIAK